MTEAMRRAALCVPASEPAKIGKAAALDVDEIVVDLEDAVVPDAKDSARENVRALRTRPRGLVAVRVNAIGSRWCERDLLECAANDAVTSIVIPKVESPDDVRAVDSVLSAMEDTVERAAPVIVQILIESARGLADVEAIASASARIRSLVIGYADLSVSLGRRADSSWQYAQDRVLLAARVNGLQAIDGPHLGVEDDAEFRARAATAATLGFDGKWVIHPRQIAAVQDTFTPTKSDIKEAQEILAALDTAAAGRQGAVAWRGRMLDEAVAQQARRVLSRSGGADTG